MSKKEAIKLNDDDVQRLQGKPYVLYKALLRLAHENGVESIITDLVSYDAKENRAIMYATVTGLRGTFTGYGDADPSNVNRNIAKATIRMAETRAKGRALRDYLGIGMTAAEELPGRDSEPQISRNEPSRKAFKPPVMVDVQAQGCAVCGRLVNREQAELTTGRDLPVLCAGHYEQWLKPVDESWQGETRSTFIDALAAVAVDYPALELRCVASPTWGKLPSQMTMSERAQLLEVLTSHHNRKSK